MKNKTEILKQIEKIVETHKCNYCRHLKKKDNRHLYDYIMDFTKNHDLHFAERVYWTLNDLHEKPKCVNCGNPLSDKVRCFPLRGYVSNHCSVSCSLKDKNIQEKIRENNLKKYGEVSPLKTLEIRKKISAIKQGYSTEKREQINERRRTTCIMKYGVDSISRVAEIREKAKQTIANQSLKRKQEIVNKIKSTKMQRYGSVSYANPEKHRKTMEARTPEQRRQINEKRKQTFLKKYGVEYAVLLLNAKKSSTTRKRLIMFNQTIKQNQFAEPLFSVDDYIEHGRNFVYQWKCKKCGEVFFAKVCEHQRAVAQCAKCYPLTQPFSKKEKELTSFVKSLYKGQILENSRKVIPPKELDIWIPNLKLGIEFDGLYWHSESKHSSESMKFCHIEKTTAVEAIGGQLIHIFENEWNNKQEIVKSYIAAKCGCFERTISASNCFIQLVEADKAIDFMNKYHINGPVKTTINIGLFENQELVALGSFSKARFSKNHDYELRRYCTQLNSNVEQGLKTILNYFENMYHPKSLVVNLDRRWHIAADFQQYGFYVDNITSPDYWYWTYGNGYQLESRMNYQKSRLPKLLSNFDSQKTEVENMFENGFSRIFDCGKIVMAKFFKI